MSGLRQGALRGVQFVGNLLQVAKALFELVGYLGQVIRAFLDLDLDRLAVLERLLVQNRGLAAGDLDFQKRIRGRKVIDAFFNLGLDVVALLESRFKCEVAGGWFLSFDFRCRHGAPD